MKKFSMFVGIVGILSLIFATAAWAQPGMGPGGGQGRGMELLEYMEIADRADYLPALLEDGEQQRVAIARALANNPRLILADAPTASLDTGRGKKVMEMLKKIAKENQSAVIVVTHDVRMIEGFD